MRDQARRCTANSKRSGERCRQNCLLKPDGTYTKNCRFHKGGVELLPPGDPALGGAPPTTWLRVERLPEAQRPVYEAALAQSPISRYDQLIAFAYAQLDAYLEHHGLAVVDGYKVEWQEGRVIGETIQPHFDVVHRHLDAIRKLEKDRAAIVEASGGGDGDGTQDYASWLAGVRASKRRRR